MNIRKLKKFLYARASKKAHLPTFSLRPDNWLMRLGGIQYQDQFGIGRAAPAKMVNVQPKPISREELSRFFPSGLVHEGFAYRPSWNKVDCIGCAFVILGVLPDIDPEITDCKLRGTGTKTQCSSYERPDKKDIIWVKRVEFPLYFPDFTADNPMGKP